ncbi:MAG: methyltransferase domain-containing protein [Gammaproteobacteria bacterium]|jgi:SAM-dependent methyltransferase
MNRPSEWWEEFFRGPWGEFQAQGFPFPQEATHAEVDFLVSTLDLKAGDSVLDLACGIGRHSIELAALGMDVTAVDFNPGALDAAKRAATERSVCVHFVEQDMRELAGTELYDTAICFWTSFGYFEDEADDLRVAKRVARSLKPGGRFLIDLQVKESVFPRFQERRWTWFDEERPKRLLEEVNFNVDNGRVDAEWTFIENGVIRSNSSSIRLYSYRELCELLREAGFQTFEGLETVTGKRFKLGSQRLSLVATV